MVVVTGFEPANRVLYQAEPHPDMDVPCSFPNSLGQVLGSSRARLVLCGLVCSDSRQARLQDQMCPAR